MKQNVTPEQVLKACKGMWRPEHLIALEEVARLAADYKRQFADYNSPEMPMSQYPAAFDSIQTVKAALFAALDELERERE